MAELTFKQQLDKLERGGREVSDLRRELKRMRDLVGRRMTQFIKDAYAMDLNNADIARMIGTSSEAIRQHAERAGLENPRATRVKPFKHPVHRAARRKNPRRQDSD